jgi:hypothetical protein
MEGYSIYSGAAGYLYSLLVVEDRLRKVFDSKEIERTLGGLHRVIEIVVQYIL